MSHVETLYCSFCGKSQYQVKQIIAGPSVNICDECIGICASTIAQKGKEGLIQEAQEQLFKTVSLFLRKAAPLEQLVESHAEVIRALTRVHGSPQILPFEKKR